MAVGSGLLLSRGFAESHGDAIAQVEDETGVRFERVLLPGEPDARLGAAACARVELAYFSGDLFPQGSRAFFAAAHASPRLRWLHVFHAGTDHEVYARFRERGVTMTNSSGSTGVPIAQTAIAGLLMLARGFPGWLEGQRRREWRSAQRAPRDLAEQTLVVVGLGAIGSEIARLGAALGLRVIGVRRSPPREGDPTDEVVPPARLDALLPEADWLALACPLTDETRGWIDARALARLPRGARVLNVCRGEVIDEAALIEALRSEHLGGAYLDVFETEPLPAESPLWSLPNVIVTPHASAASIGNPRRQAEIFLHNLRRWARKEPLEHQVD